jgi:DNA-binding NarL/FixJ family response regulator
VQTSKSFCFLLVSDSADDHGNQVLREALAALGYLQSTAEADMESHLQGYPYDVVIVDAGAVKSAPEVVSRVHALDPDTKTVVVTASPHWKIAKAVIQAGAVDYLSKSLNKEKIVSSFRTILAEFPLAAQ